MITAVVLAEHSIEALAATLSALVPGVAQSVVADAVVVARAPYDPVARVADAMGAKLVAIDARLNPWATAAAVARREWLLCLEEGDVPLEGWIGAVERFISGSSGRRRLGQLAHSRPLSRGSLQGLTDRLAGAPRVRPGMLVHRGLLGPDSLVERVRPVPLHARMERKAKFR